jgi:hypothetical protein
MQGPVVLLILVQPFNVHPPLCEVDLTRLKFSEEPITLIAIFPILELFVAAMVGKCIATL